MTIPDIWLPADTVRLGNALTGPGRVKGTLALVVDDDLLAALSDPATTAPEPAPATALGAVVGRSATGQPNSCGQTPPAAPDVKTGSLPAKAGRPNSRPPLNATNPGAADPGAVNTSAAVNSGAARPS